ncbi:MAG: HU family DNA-binding protein, partial [Gemmatimonadetes bacterium]|nr:HU family DNA-binding protein [Gemmatimonadota bacterium]
MNRDSLVKEVASDLQVSRHKVRVVLNGFLSEVTEAMHQDERVNLHRFGAFSVKVRKARTARDLNTNVELRLSDRQIPHFLPFDTLKDIVAQQSPVSEEQTGPVAAGPAKQQVEETPRERSDDISAMMTRAEVLANKGKIEQAIQQYRRIL